VNWRLAPDIAIREGRISANDANRQMRTAAEILRRLNRQPGVILADEVGMGKTYVALAVAVSVVEATQGERPVVVMVPSSFREKWPREWDVFEELCLKNESTWIRATEEAINRPGVFFKLLDDPPRTRRHIIFLTHGALTNALGDPFTRLALVRRALGRKRLHAQRRVFPRWAERVFPGTQHFRNQRLVEALLDRNPREWRTVLRKALIDPGDDPVPDALLRVLPSVDIAPLVDALTHLPLRTGAHVDERLRRVRSEVAQAIQEVWRRCMREMHIELPLLILDEAHHLKNRWTRFASLFETPEAEKDVELLRGPFGSVFDRMLFLTATPFQLGHHELIEVLRRFTAIRWGDGLEREAYVAELELMERALSAAQTAALRLDQSWGSLEPEVVAEFAEEAWWTHPEGEDLPESLRSAARRLADVRDRMREAEELIRPWVIRHIRVDKETRRNVLSGQAILGEDGSVEKGLEVGGPAVLPFLLAARVQALVSSDVSLGATRARAYFAEGLASSFEAYRDTRERQQLRESIDDAEAKESSDLPSEARWYLDHLDRALPKRRAVAGAHPKIAATTERVVELWRTGEKVVVFCFYIATGRALRAHISQRIQDELLHEGARKLGIRSGQTEDVFAELERLSLRFFDPDAPVTKAATATVSELFAPLPMADDEREQAVDVVLRFLRTPSFLVRYTDLREANRVRALEKALSRTDVSGRSVRDKIQGFGRFVADRVEQERAELLDALATIHTGTIFASSEEAHLPGELAEGRRALVPNVRLANGQVSHEARRRLMLTFNTPFFPEVLISSAVMGEGVDLHLECRHTIHHDLDWNPSVLEQRTGRLDRLGSKSELTGRPIVVYEPFLEGTQDERQYRVVKDRERWFNVVMGEKLTLDERSTERLAERVELPEAAARELALRLEVVR
jgi:Helicase conserved C-terminal domain/SNF2-related domain